MNYTYALFTMAVVMPIIFFTNARTLTHIPTDLMIAWTTFCLYENFGFDITSPDVEFSLSMA